MQGIAVNEFKCKEGDVACYCGNPNFLNGVRDCSNESCQNKEDAAKAIDFGNNYCKSSGSGSGSGSGSSGSSCVFITPPSLPDGRR